jgi:hypothetical protein
MLGMGMLLGGKPVFRVELNLNQNQWAIVSDAPHLLVAYPITLHLIVAAGVTIASSSYIDAAISLFGLPNGSDVYLTNNGQITGASSASGSKANGGRGVYGNWNGGRLFLTNGSGWITAGTMVDGLSDAVYMAGSPVSVLQWVSGASRITGTVYP